MKLGIFHIERMIHVKSKEKSAKLAQKYAQLFRCSLCKSPMKVVDLKSLVCTRNHTFDFAKQGYVNMLNRSINSQYDKELFTARQKMIMDSHLFTPLHKKITEIILENIAPRKKEMIIFDAGCGEGSHLQRILEECGNENIVGIGLDIAKEGIIMAARNYKNSIWLVGDLANTPMADASCDVIINILSPANYSEFKRMLSPNGIVIKVVPRDHYLKQLREVLFDDSNKKTYQNDDIVSHFNSNFRLLNMQNLKFTAEISENEFMNLLQMTPLAWNLSKKKIKRISEITIDLDILVGINKR